MLREWREQRSLAANLARTTFAAVAVSVFLVAAFALAGVYALTKGQLESGQAAYRRIVGSELESRLRSAANLLDAAADAVTERGVDPRSVSRYYTAGTDHFESLLVVRTDGRVLVSLPVTAQRTVVAGRPYFRPEESSSTPAFTFVPPAEGEPSQLWAHRSVVGADGERYVLLAKLRTSFLRLVLGEVSSATRKVAITDASGGVLLESSEGPALRLTPRDFRGDPGDTQGAIRGRTPDGTAVAGRWSRVTGGPEPGWRVVLVEPSSVVLRETWRALLPAGLVSALAGLLAVLVAWLGARRLVGPLKEIGVRAARAASGSYVRPIAVQRSDEVGALAEAFNALGLRLNALHDVGQLLATASEPEQVLDQVTSALRHIVHPDAVAVYITDESGESVSLTRSQGVAGLPLPSRVSTRAPSWLAEALHAEGPTCIMGRLAQQAAGSGSHVVAEPLVLGTERVGLLIVSRQRSEFTPAELEMLRTFSGQAAAAIRTSRGFEAEKAARREAETLRSVAERLSDPRGAAAALDDIITMAGELLGADRGGVVLVRPELFGMPTRRSEGPWLRLWSAVRGEDEDLTPVILTDAAGRPELAGSTLGKNSSVLLAPVVTGTELRGVLGFEFHEGEHALEHRLTLAVTVAKELALALENTFLLRQAQERAGSLETIFRITQAVSSSLQISVVLNRVLDVVQKIFSADAVSLMKYDPKRRVISTAMARGLVSAEILHLVRRPGEDVPGEVFETRLPLVIPKLYPDEHDLARLASAQGLRSLVAVPLLARGRSIGVLTIFSMEEAAFTPEDVELLRTFAAQASLAIDTADLYGKEHTVATVLRSSIMPERLPQLDGIDSSSVYIAAGIQDELGGDYYDVFRAPDGRVALAMGDVCGKGIVAATKTSMIRHTVRALIAAGMEPAECLSEVNRAVTDAGQPGDIVTLWLGLLDVASGDLTYANAGHPPALLAGGLGQDVKKLGPTGALLGAIPYTPYEQSLVPVPTDGMLLLYTDGVSEARKGNKFFGEGRITQAMLAGGPAAAVTQRVMNEVSAFTSGNLRDDIAILAVRLCNGAATETRSS